MVYVEYLLSFWESGILVYFRQGGVYVINPPIKKKLGRVFNELSQFDAEELSGVMLSPLEKRLLGGLCLVSSKVHPMDLCFVSFFVYKSQLRI